jgi:hypothetical protein
MPLPIHIAIPMTMAMPIAFVIAIPTRQIISHLSSSIIAATHYRIIA